MTKHEEKRCPRCNAVFECKTGNIGQCQCYGVAFTEEQRRHIESTFSDCLCRTCLNQLREASAHP